MIVSRELEEASRDYRFLLDRGYPPKASLALVGNRWRLDAEERLVLFRGVASTADSLARSAKLQTPGRGEVVLVDLYNVSFTIVHYLIGKPCFVSSDGFLRDAGANYGRIAHDAELLRAFDLIASALIGLSPFKIEAYLDAPVSRSGEHVVAFRGAWDAARKQAEAGTADPEAVAAENMDCVVEAVHSADGAIAGRLAAWRTDGREAFVLSSDSAVIDRSAKALDLARQIITSVFGKCGGEADGIPWILPPDGA